LTAFRQALPNAQVLSLSVQGVSLSGGQKARIALARAVYSYNAHVLLDDVLAAVDSHTARHLVDHCLNGPILAGRTVLMVSHHVELLLPISAYLVRMLAGRVDNHGTPASLQEKGLLDGFIATESMIAHRTEESNEMEAEKVAHDDSADKKARPGRKLVQDEERTTGSVPFQTYKTYIVRSTWTVWIITIVLLGCSQLAINGERIWLKLWGSAYSVQGTTMGFMGTRSESLATDLHFAAAQQHYVAYRHQPVSRIQHAWLSLPSADLHPGYYLFGLAMIDLASFAISILSTLNTSWGSYKAAISIHDSMLDRVMGADIRFFDTTPSGRIINRFSKDVETIDNSLSSTLKTVLGNVALLIGSIAMVASILPGFLLPASFIGYAFYMLTTRYLATSRSLRRIEATKRSPIFSGFSEVLDGLTIVRAFGAESLLMRK
jgi:ABC-type multidrug transport system fused ATPase/permease subunit